jgi:uncharacterized protein YbjT (DUF2867 family)
MNIIITGATGMVGEGVLLEILDNPKVQRVLMVNRKHFDLTHPKLSELIVPDFMNIDRHADELSGYDACFYCAGISSIGLDEATYTHITYDITMCMARALQRKNPTMVFTFVSGRGTNIHGRQMWARVKGKTEKDLLGVGFKSVYNFRPALMKPVKGQRNIKPIFRIVTSLYPVWALLFPNSCNTLREVTEAMISCTEHGYHKNILEVSDIHEASLAT